MWNKLERYCLLTLFCFESCLIFCGINIVNNLKFVAGFTFISFSLRLARNTCFRGLFFFFFFFLRFYGPVNPCRARSVYLTTRLLGRLSPLSGIVHILSPETDN